MRIKLDENLPHRLVAALTDLGHDVDTAVHEGLTGRDDRFLITQDLDFSDIRHYAPGTHRGLLLVRLRFPGRTSPGRSRTFLEVRRGPTPGACLQAGDPRLRRGTSCDRGGSILSRLRGLPRGRATRLIFALPRMRRARRVLHADRQTQCDQP